MKENDIYKKNNDDTNSRHFIIEDITLMKVKEFMKNNNRKDLNESINDLINLGLSNINFADNDEIFSTQKNLKTVFQIIKSLTQESQQRNAHRTNILLRARSEGISPTKTTELIDSLKTKEKIYEPKKDYFKIKS